MDLHCLSKNVLSNALFASLFLSDFGDVQIVYLLIFFA